MKISVIVTNWNGISLLKKNFLQIIASAPFAHEILFADDGSEDDSLAYIQEISKKYPYVKIISHPKNVGFAKNSNHAVTKAGGDLVVLLNNDISPSINFYQPSISLFDQADVFGVGFSEIGHENYAKIFWKDGYFQHTAGHSLTTHITGWLSGGGSIIRRDLFLKLGGFDEVYAPFYSEDLDLGYRAWKSGYRCLWEPKCSIEHHHESTMSRFPHRLLDYVKERNRLLSVWRNITDPALLTQHRLALIGRILTGPNYIKIIRAAYKQIHSAPPPIVFPQLSDTQIFSLFRHD